MSLSVPPKGFPQQRNFLSSVFPSVCTPIVADLFGEEQYFDDIAKFWELQNTAIASAKDAYLADGWQDVIVLDIGDYFASYEYVDTAKEDCGKVYVRVSNDGEEIGRASCRERVSSPGEIWVVAGSLKKKQTHNPFTRDN